MPAAFTVATSEPSFTVAVDRLTELAALAVLVCQPQIATTASKAISTGVAHGEANNPPRIPAIAAPKYPRLLFLFMSDD